MSINTRQDYSRADGETSNHIVRWVHEMYSRGRSPIESINQQARRSRRSASAIKMDVLVACRPGGHDRMIEASKKKYTKDWKREQ